MEYKFNNYYEMLISSANEHPKSIAIFDDKKKISYEELRNKVDMCCGFFDKVTRYLTQIKSAIELDYKFYPKFNSSIFSNNIYRRMMA
ncbi:hypothetical protein CFF27374_08525 [Campylobacter fetus subsp. fetus]|nr:hypothetical protein CFF27374_08525 [Campylobacter fetus subsp. fetus]